MAQNEQSHARLGLAVAKKSVRAAHDRNRVKRLIRESFRKSLAVLPACDVIILAQPAARQAGNRLINGELEKIWQACQARSDGS